MSQHDLTIANQGFPAFRSDLNNALQALGSTQAGATAPSPTFAHQMWIDTSSAPNVLKIRNADNDAWITVGQLNQSADTFNLAVAQGGTGSTTQSGARTNLGLGSIATQASSNVTITGGSITGITDLAVADGGTGRSTLTAENVLLGDGTNAVKFVAPGTSGNVLTSNGTTWASAAAPKSKFFRTRVLSSGTTYNKPSDVKELYVFIYGSTGGLTNSTSQGGGGGPGYSEKYYASPSSSYTYAIGAGGTASGTQGGTTSWDSGSVSVTGGAGKTTGTAGSAGGVGSGGDFNASGGTGGNSANNGGGGGGGAGSRAGNGGNGGNGSGGIGGGGGGTGGNNASGATPGAGATAPSGSAIVLPFSQLTETFLPGSTGSSAFGGQGAAGYPKFDTANPGIGFAFYDQLFLGSVVSPGSSTGKGGQGDDALTSQLGSQGHILLVEVCE